MCRSNLTAVRFHGFVFGIVERSDQLSNRRTSLAVDGHSVEQAQTLWGALRECILRRECRGAPDPANGRRRGPVRQVRTGTNGSSVQAGPLPGTRSQPVRGSRVVHRTGQTSRRTRDRKSRSSALRSRRARRRYARNAPKAITSRPLSAHSWPAPAGRPRAPRARMCDDCRRKTPSTRRRDARGPCRFHR